MALQDDDWVYRTIHERMTESKNQRDKCVDVSCSNIKLNTSLYCITHLKRKQASAVYSDTNSKLTNDQKTREMTKNELENNSQVESYRFNILSFVEPGLDGLLEALQYYHDVHGHQHTGNSSHIQYMAEKLIIDSLEQLNNKEEEEKIPYIVSDIRKEFKSYLTEVLKEVKLIVMQNQKMDIHEADDESDSEVDHRSSTSLTVPTTVTTTATTTATTTSTANSTATTTASNTRTVRTSQTNPPLVITTFTTIITTHTADSPPKTPTTPTTPNLMLSKSASLIEKARSRRRSMGKMHSPKQNSLNIPNNPLRPPKWLGVEDSKIPLLQNQDKDELAKMLWRSFQKRIQEKQGGISNEIDPFFIFKPISGQSPVEPIIDIQVVFSTKKKNK